MMETNWIRLDRMTQALLTTITGLLAVLVVELWAFQPPLVGEARAQIPNAGMQRVEQLEQQRRTNELLEAILHRLESGPVPVRVENPERGKKNRGGP
jgi:hypothetical protein